MRVCTVCTHPQRDEIDLTLASGLASKRQLALKYGLIDVSIHRHERRHLDPRLIEAAKTTDAADAKRLLNRVDKIVSRLEKRCEEMDDQGQLGALLKVVRELRPYQELYGRASKELAADQVNALFVTLGVRDEAELQRAVGLAKSGRDVSPEAFRDEVFQGLRFLLSEHPEWRQDALHVIEGASYAEVLNGNGTPRQALGPGEDP